MRTGGYGRFRGEWVNLLLLLYRNAAKEFLRKLRNLTEIILYVYVPCQYFILFRAFDSLFCAWQILLICLEECLRSIHNIKVSTGTFNCL